MSALGLVTLAGRTLRAGLLKGDPALVENGAPLGLFWYAVGTGNWADKENPPPESAAATGLASEYARKLVTRTAYLQLDAATGTVLFNGQKYKEVAGPTAIIAVFADLAEAEAAGVEVVEEGLFGGSVVTAARPFALAAEVSTPGVLYWVRHRALYRKGLRDTLSPIIVFEET